MLARQATQGSNYLLRKLDAWMTLFAVVIAASLHVKRRRPRPTPREAPQTPQPVPGRQHIDLQTEPFLEELTDVVAEEAAGARACDCSLPCTRCMQYMLACKLRVLPNTWRSGGCLPLQQQYMLTVRKQAQLAFNRCKASFTRDV